MSYYGAKDHKAEYRRASLRNSGFQPSQPKRPLSERVWCEQSGVPVQDCQHCKHNRSSK